MRKFLWGTAFGALLLVFLAAGLLWLAPWWLQRPPKLPMGTTLALKLSGPISEQEPQGTIPYLEVPSWTTIRLWDTIQKAADDPRIAAILLLPEKPEAGWATLAEVRNAILSFRKKSGKPVYAFLRSPNSRDYYLASAADRITATPGDFLDVKGLRVEMLYARQALDKLGILPEVESIGRYKDGADILTRSSMSEETREVMNAILDKRFQGFVDAIAQGRRKTSGEVRQILEQGPFLAAGAVKAGILDATEFEDQTRTALAKLLGQTELKPLSAAEYQRVSNGSKRFEGNRRIAFVAAEGDILRSSIPVFADHILEPTAFGELMREIREDSGIAAVILRIDSPGGDAIASDEMLRDLKRLAERKPVIVSMSDVAASGGYALAMGGHWIEAYPETVTGSIGVFFGKVTLSGLYSKLGLQKELLTRGRFADIDSDVRPLSPEARKKLRDSLVQVYSSFVGQVAAARKRNYAEIDRVAQGRVWLGDQAKDAGLVDELGGLDRAIEVAKERAHISAAESVRLVVYPRQPTFWQALQFRLKPAFEVRTGTASYLRIPAAIWKRIPFGFDIQ